MQQNSSYSAYRADIDGLRAIAILSVVVYHAFPALLPGGFVGVDIFFVISGFLISGIIFAKIEDNTFSYMDFYIRRIKRIFPALVVVLSAVFAVGWFVLFSSEFKGLGANIAAAAVFLSNILLWHQSGYFDPDSSHKQLLHLWSLGVEEQFYILWPVLAGMAWRRWSLFSLTVALGTASFLLNLYLTYTHPVSAFYLPFSRFWELMVGGALACPRILASKVLRLPVNLQSFAGAILIVLGLVFTTSASPFPGWRALLPTMGCMLLISAGQRAKINSVMLSNPILVGVGLISYPLYLWHWPLLCFLRLTQGGELPPNKAIAAIGLSLLLALLTYRVIERPIRIPGRAVAVPAVLTCTLLALGLGGLAVWKSRGIVSRRINLLNPSDNVIGDASGTIMNECGLAPKDKRKIGSCFSDKREQPIYGILGDSKAAALFPGLVALSKPGGRWLIIGGNGDNGAPVPVLSEIPGYASFQPLTRAASDALIRNPDIRVVVLTAAIRSLIPTYNGLLNRPGSNLEYQDAFDGLDRMITKLASSGKEVVITMDNPTLPDPEWCMKRQTGFPFLDAILTQKQNTRCFLSIDAFKQQTSMYRLMLEKLEQKWQGHVMIYDPSAELCNQKNDTCSISMDGHILYSYTDHISAFAAMRVARGLIPIVALAESSDKSKSQAANGPDNTAHGHTSFKP